MSKKNYILSVIIAVVAFVMDFLLMIISVFLVWMISNFVEGMYISVGVKKNRW